ncbi:hypothetical protein EW093_01260 [Thiospirochaeta perfilievii]|uniref:Uncharacterized protein n=1 Tax=Thiospirochaeta perfilievii TaxID=252967 RepID=A0A5C1Q994_9SPIO|nr:hypothetical protein [Thiospirochaeta perfilievii]QEN03386.1 hypothetical protein EW093_01260 [Thiospirochaeta perfilievii]
MKQGIIVLVLLVGTIFVVSANGYGRDETERQGRNVVAPEDCTLDEPGTGYLDENKRGYQNQPNPKGRGRNRS